MADGEDPCHPQRQPDKRVNYTLAKNDKLVQCPYDSNHLILTTRLCQHLLKCKQNYERKCISLGRTNDMKICRYHWIHHVKASDLQNHEMNCPYNRAIVDRLQLGQTVWGEEPEDAPTSDRVVNDDIGGGVSASLASGSSGTPSAEGPVYRPGSRVAGVVGSRVVTGNIPSVHPYTRAGRDSSLGATSSISTGAKPVAETMGSGSLGNTTTSSQEEEDWGAETYVRPPVRVPQTAEERYFHPIQDMRPFSQIPPGLNKVERQGYRIAQALNYARTILVREYGNGEPMDYGGHYLDYLERRGAQGRVPLTVDRINPLGREQHATNVEQEPDQYPVKREPDE